MSYEVTATRRRPQKFDDLAGQEFVAATLKNSIESGKIAHAYLFSGPRGCGKTSTARILAKALNCKDGPTAVPCGTCTACREITKGSSMDVIEIDGASNTSVNDVRQIKDEVLFPPNSLKYKIYIIDEVHMLSTSAFNALLKTIEEPPPYVIFIFATTELQKVPATIKSRCQQFNFRLVPVETIKKLLADAAAEVNIKAEDEALFWIARESTGSIRDAYTLFDQIAAFSDGNITYEKIRDKLGLVGIDRLNEIFLKCVSGDAHTVLETLDSFLQSGISIDQLILNSTEYLRNLLLLKNGITKESLLGQSPDRYNTEVREAWTSIQLERALSIFLQLYRDIRYSLSPRYELELAFSRLCWLKQYISPPEVKKAIDDARKLLLEEPHDTAVPNQAPPQNNNADKNITAEGPSGMPQFSALGSIGQKIPENETILQPPEQELPPDYQETSQGSPYPFGDGGALPPDQSAAAQQKNTLQVKNRELTIKQLRSSVIADLSVTDALTASALIQTGDWYKNEQSIRTTIQSSFQKVQLDKKIQEITACIKRISGEDLTFSVEVEEQQSNRKTSAPIPRQVDLLCKIFKGTVIGGKT
ncbi:MAG: DNA polymerase III subunit gamma/tau [Treponema sp.]|jgi:DNA polymerase-3 subunit gamma/tau|nr:DNA polymerase III subunit gamma/tau [Treponema sp.]